MNHEWQIRIQYEMDMLSYGLYMFRKLDYGTQEFMCNDGTIKTVKQGEAIKKQLWAMRFESTEQLRQLIEEAERQGVKAPTTERITGELEATKQHLFDMRAITYKHEGLMFEADVKTKPPLGKK